MNKLLLRPHVYSNECIVSYLIRVSHDNGFRHLGRLLKHAGLSWKNCRAPTHQILTGEHDIKLYLSALGLKPAKPRTIEVFNQSRSPSFTTKIFVKTPKVCPQCLEENGYCGDLWSYIAYTACHRHKIMLVDRDPVSNKKLSWYRSPKDHSALLRHLQASPPQEASECTIALSKFIAHQIECKETPKSAPSILRGLNFSETLSIIHFLAHYQYRLQNSTRFNPCNQDNLTVAHYYTQAWCSLMQWPCEFYLLLNKYIDCPMSQRGLTGINKHFRDMHEKLHRQRDNKGINLLRIAFDQYIEANWPNAIQTNRLSRISLSSEARLYINTKETKNILNCREPRIKSLISQEKLTEHKFKGSTYFYRSEVESLAQLYEDNWSMEEAITETELSRYQLKQLLDSRHIKTLQNADSQNRDWLISKNDWLRLMTFFKQSATRKPTKRGKTLSGFQKQGLSINDVFSLLKAKEVNFGFTQSPEKPNSFRQLWGFTLKA